MRGGTASPSAFAGVAASAAILPTNCSGMRQRPYPRHLGFPSNSDEVPGPPNLTLRALSEKARRSAAKCDALFD